LSQIIYSFYDINTTFIILFHLHILIYYISIIYSTNYN